MINYTVIKVRHSLNFVFIHEGLHMELHLYLNVYMDGMFLSSRVRLEGGMGSRAETTDEAFCRDCLHNRDSSLNGQLAVCKPQHGVFLSLFADSKNKLVLLK